jgi:hypothetical protein
MSVKAPSRLRASAKEGRDVGDENISVRPVEMWIARDTDKNYYSRRNTPSHLLADIDISSSEIWCEDEGGRAISTIHVRE